MKARAMALAVLLAGCEQSPEPANPANGTDGRQAPAAAEPSSGPHWALRADGGATVLAYGAQRIQLICPSGERRLLVNVPAFRPIGSEERLSFGGGGEVVALVADTAGDAQRGGVTGSGALPSHLAQLISGEISASYGAQTAGPFPQPPAEMAAAFVAACRPQNGGGAEAGTPPPPPPDNVSACLIQDGERIPEHRLHAIGTEPFWAADVKGRCVTYSTPENQSGTRIWTQFGGSTERGSWTGFYQDQRFVMRTRPQAGCSDGMSDDRYPIAVTLTVAGEQRTGCAERK